ncbi:hypothetical protein [Streptomyces pratensis]|uniref:hypothetical protein n=1 Tax=Streptomyces pratensis TaxID=1169025 RepID=UPI00363AD54B
MSAERRGEAVGEGQGRDALEPFVAAAAPVGRAADAGAQRVGGAGLGGEQGRLVELLGPLWGEVLGSGSLPSGTTPGIGSGARPHGGRRAGGAEGA